MQYNKDINEIFADIFKKIRAILLSYSQIKEIKNTKQTSYYDEYGVVAMLRVKGDSKLVVSFARGAKLQEKFPILKGSGKVVMHLYFNPDYAIELL